MVLIYSVVSMKEPSRNKCLVDDSEVEGEETGASDSKVCLKASIFKGFG